MMTKIDKCQDDDENCLIMTEIDKCHDDDENFIVLVQMSLPYSFQFLFEHRMYPSIQVEPAIKSYQTQDIADVIVPFELNLERVES